MKIKLSIFLLLMVVFSFGQNDTLLFEDFESSTNLPAGWSVETNATTYTGFFVGDTSDANAGGYWDVLHNGSNNFAITNDDAANDFLEAERLILPPIDLSTDTNMLLSYDIYSDAAKGGSVGYVEISLDTGITWIKIDSSYKDWTQW